MPRGIHRTDCGIDHQNCGSGAGAIFCVDHRFAESGSKSQILKDRRSHRCNSGDDQQQSPAFSVYEQGRAAGFFQLRKA